MRRCGDDLASAKLHRSKHGRPRVSEGRRYGFAVACFTANHSHPLRRQSRQSRALWRASPRCPRLSAWKIARLFSLASSAVVGRVGVEPTTSRLSGVRSNHLSYRPPCHAEPTPSCSKRRGRRRREPAQASHFAYRSVFPVMKGHEDGGECSLEWEEALPDP